MSRLLPRPAGGFKEKEADMQKRNRFTKRNSKLAVHVALSRKETVKHLSPELVFIKKRMKECIYSKS